MRVLIIAFCVSVSLPGFSQVSVAPQALESRLNEASVVCVCSLSESSGRPSTNVLENQMRVYIVEVIKTYKGALGGGTFKATPAGTPIMLTKNVRYILMLYRASGGPILVIASALPVPADFPVRAAPGAPRTLEGDLDNYVLRKSGHGEASETEDVIKILDQYQALSSASVRVLSSLTTSSVKPIALLSTAVLLRRGIDVSHLFLLYLSELEGISGQSYPDIGDVSFILTQNANSSEIPQLERLAKLSPNRQIRIAALRALRKIADPSTTGFMIKELDAPDTESQYQALITLATLYHKGGEYGPGIGEFEANKAKYIRLWKEWYRESYK